MNIYKKKKKNWQFFFCVILMWTAIEFLNFVHINSDYYLFYVGEFFGQGYH